MERYRYVVDVDGAVYRDGEYLLVERAADEDHAAGALGVPGGTLETAPGARARWRTRRVGRCSRRSASTWTGAATPEVDLDDVYTDEGT